MSESFLGEIRLFAGNFAPTGWALCNGQLMAISQNTALFSLLGTNYGGDGRTTFGLPDLQSRAPVHAGSSGGPGLTPRDVGETGGSSTVTLLSSEMPNHTHALSASAGDAGDRSPAAEKFANESGGVNSYAAAGSPVAMALQMVGPTGGSQPHNNMQPYLAVTFIIALQGIFPQRP